MIEIQHRGLILNAGSGIALTVPSKILTASLLKPPIGEDKPLWIEFLDPKGETIVERLPEFGSTTRKVRRINDCGDLGGSWIHRGRPGAIIQMVAINRLHAIAPDYVGLSFRSIAELMPLFGAMTEA